MKQLYFTIIYIILFAFSFASCSKEEFVTKYDLGKCEYYPSFLWVKSKDTFINKTIKLDFNSAAKQANSYAILQLVDKNKKPINMEEYTVYIDGNKLNRPEIMINAEESSLKKFKIGCTPQASAGNKCIYFLLKKGHTLDRINDTHLENQQGTTVLRCDIRYTKNMNPLLLSILFILLGILVIISVWFLIIRPMRYPHFKAIKKTIYLNDVAPISINFKGARMVIIDNKNHSQSIWDKIFRGLIICKVSPAVQAPIIMLPRKKDILIKADTTKYSFNNRMPRVGRYSMRDLTNNIDIEIM